MGSSLGFVVACINQASGQPEDALASEILWPDRDSAECDRECAQEAQYPGRRDRYIVCEVFEVTDG